MKRQHFRGHKEPTLYRRRYVPVKARQDEQDRLDARRAREARKALKRVQTLQGPL
jgi:hypothetical protein